jgi:hypothetical protein
VVKSRYWKRSRSGSEKGGSPQRSRSKKRSKRSDSKKRLVIIFVYVLGGTSSSTLYAYVQEFAMLPSCLLLYFLSISSSTLQFICNYSCRATVFDNRNFQLSLLTFMLWILFSLTFNFSLLTLDLKLVLRIQNGSRFEYVR